MESVDSLIESINQYELQLEQVNTALRCLPKGSDRDDLLNLKNDIEELLKLTRESLENANNGISPEPSPEPENDGLADEYAQFKAELEELNNISDDTNKLNEIANSEQSRTVEEADIREDLEEMVGTKCQAPYENKLGISSYHNALISAVNVLGAITDANQIQVRVMFTNPTEKEMVPCPFYLDNKCTFKEKCNYSHGKSVSFSALKEYNEPDFSNLKSGSRVLAKFGSHLWTPSVVESLSSNQSCTLKHEGRFVEVALEHVLPLTSSGEESEEDTDLSDSEVELFEAQKYDQETIIELSLNNKPSTGKLGEWEQYTKGIGSRLMAKMGYIVGSGLGKSGEGRLDPIEATILPAGKSLDHCMELKEKAGGSKDLFSAEKIQQKLALKELKKSKRRYYREKQQEKHNVFTVINKLSATGGGSSKRIKAREFHKKLATTSSRDLNVERLKVEEDIRQTERNIFVLKDSLTRQKVGSIPHNNILAKLNSAQGHLEALNNFDTKVAREQNLRETKRKLTVF